MDSALTIGLGSSPSTTLRPSLKPNQTISLSSPLHFSISSKPRYGSNLKIKAVASSPKSVIRNLRTAAATIILAAAAAGKFHQLPARAETPMAVTEEKVTVQDQNQQEEEEVGGSSFPSYSPLTQFLESNAEAIDALKSLLQQKLEAGEDKEALKILKNLISAQPEEIEWKFLMARLLSETGNTQEARQVFEEILVLNPLSFEALFENALLMDRCGEGNAVIGRLQEALKIAEDENKVKEARDVRLIMAQIQFLHKNVDEALSSYEELAREDPNDFRPYFCKGMIYSLLDRNKEAREEFAKYRELSPKKFEVEGYLRTSLSRMKLFGTDEEN